MAGESEQGPELMPCHLGCRLLPNRIGPTLGFGSGRVE
jgi:hypothetical protein